VSVTLIHRGPGLSTHIKYWVRPDILNRIERGEVKAFLETEVVAVHPAKLELRGRQARRSDRERCRLALTGYQPDYSFLSSMGIGIDSESGKPQSIPTPASRTCGITRRRHRRQARNNKIFIENGRFHGKKIVEHRRILKVDVVLRNGRILDGTGAPELRGISRSGRKIVSPEGRSKPTR
jgi:hypothetical protein